VTDEAGPIAPLVERAAAGDQAAFDELVDRFAPLVWRIARSYRLSAADAGDVSQTTWLRLVEALDRIREPERLGAWLVTTAKREALATIRRRDRLVPDADLSAVEPELPGRVPSVAPTGSEVLEASETRVAVLEAWATLPERCRGLLALLLADPPVPYEEISASLTMPIGSIGPTRQRCLARLRDHEALVRITGRAGASPQGGEERR
jgi:RNA polymerase sigma factor (sigma-70 family)